MIINHIKKFYAFEKDIDFAKFLGISPQVLYNWKSRNTFDAELIYTKCMDINPEWILTGSGSMLKKDDNLKSYASKNAQKSIPLIPLESSLGFASDEYQIKEHESEHFIIPTFKAADYLMYVKGSSMYPKFSSGDIVACKKLALDDLFFQLDKVYVLETAQGVLVKRIKSGSTEDHIMIVSENDSYDTFELHMSKINAVAIVIGVIRLD